MTKNNYWVSPKNGDWQAKREGSPKASRVFDTQREAADYARGVLKNNGGGELITQGQHGTIVSKDTINHPDPLPPRDTEN